MYTCVFSFPSLLHSLHTGYTVFLSYPYCFHVTCMFSICWLFVWIVWIVLCTVYMPLYCVSLHLMASGLLVVLRIRQLYLARRSFNLLLHSYLSNLHPCYYPELCSMCYVWLLWCFSFLSYVDTDDMLLYMYVEIVHVYTNETNKHIHRWIVECCALWIKN